MAEEQAIGLLKRSAVRQFCTTVLLVENCCCALCAAPVGCSLIACGAPRRWSGPQVFRAAEVTASPPHVWLVVAVAVDVAVLATLVPAIRAARTKHGPPPSRRRASARRRGVDDRPSRTCP